MVKRGFIVAFLALVAALGAACSGSNAGADAESHTYFCSCDCFRCIERDPATGQCRSNGRESFSTATCAATGAAADACASACGRFGTECKVTPGDKASEARCGG